MNDKHRIWFFLALATTSVYRQFTVLLVPPQHEQDVAILPILDLEDRPKQQLTPHYEVEIKVTTSNTNPIVTIASNTSTSLLGCDDMHHIRIIHKVAEGKQKIVYKVQLPTGEMALAKRCRSLECIRRRLLQTESHILRNLQGQYGPSNTIRFYGECDSTLGDNDDEAKLNRTHLRKVVATNFSQGYTSVLEFGTPLLPGFGPLTGTKKFLQCFARYFTEADLEGFRTVARQYAAGYTSYYYNTSTKQQEQKPKHVRLLLGEPGHTTDNKYPQNYIISKAGLRHADLDMVIRCEAGKTFDNEKYNCTYQTVLDHNCRILQGLVGKTKELNCSKVDGHDGKEETSINQRTTTPSEDNNMNAILVLSKCLARLGPNFKPKKAKKKTKKYSKANP
jgi:hypothetical protein